MQCLSRSVCRLVSFALSLSFVAARPQAKPPALVIESPAQYQVFQRQTANRGYVLIRGHVDQNSGPASFDRIEACIWGKEPLPAQAAEANCRRITYSPGAHTFDGKLAVPAGGFYTVDLRLIRKKNQIGEQSVEHVGVGEVFVISGQSNSTNFGEVRQKVKSGYVTTFDGERWRIADDPQPGVQDNSTKGSFIPAFGDAMYERFHVPIGIASVGYGGTSVRQWLPKGERFSVPPTGKDFNHQVAPGVWESDGTLFAGMMARIHQLDSVGPRGQRGFRALLWHQGESDTGQKPSHQLPAAEYGRLMEHLIKASRKDAGWKFTWFVAQVSYRSPKEPLSADLRNAQASLWKSGIALEGPDTDQLTGQNRQNNGTGVHMSDIGLQAHGRLWADKVGAWLDSVLAR